MNTKYPRTYHIPFSPGKGSDDKVMSSVNHLLGVNLVITEKIDGSNVALSHDKCYSRSHSGPPTHSSFDGFKALHATIQYKIPRDLMIFGEWCYAKHSIYYTELPSYFLMFGVRDLVQDSWLSWQGVKDWADRLELNTVPVIEKEIIFEQPKELEQFVVGEASKKSICGGDREGLVLRKRMGFANDEFPNMVAKYVRKNHVTTNIHWKFQEIIKNGIL